MCCEMLRKIIKDIKPCCLSNSNVAEENGKKITFSKFKPNEICRLKLDKCHIDETKKKCDYLFYTCKTKEIHLVELKGTDVEYGCLQIIESHKRIAIDIKENFNESAKDYIIDDIKFKGYIVSSSVPKSTEIRFRKLQEKIYREKKIFIKKYHNYCCV